MAFVAVKTSCVIRRLTFPFLCKMFLFFCLFEEKLSFSTKKKFTNFKGRTYRFQRSNLTTKKKTSHSQPSQWFFRNFHSIYFGAIFGVSAVMLHLYR